VKSAGLPGAAAAMIMTTDRLSLPTASKVCAFLRVAAFSFVLHDRASLLDFNKEECCRQLPDGDPPSLRLMTLYSRVGREEPHQRLLVTSSFLRLDTSLADFKLITLFPCSYRASLRGSLFCFFQHFSCRALLSIVLHLDFAIAQAVLIYISPPAPFPWVFFLPPRPRGERKEGRVAKVPHTDASRVFDGEWRLFFYAFPTASSARSSCLLLPALRPSVWHTLFGCRGTDSNPSPTGWRRSADAIPRASLAS